MLADEDLDNFVEDFGDLVKVAGRGIEQLAVLSLVPGETLSGLSRANGVQLIGRADVFGMLTAADVVDVTEGNSAGLYNPAGPPAKHGDGAFVKIELNPVPT